MSNTKELIDAVNNAKIKGLPWLADGAFDGVEVFSGLKPVAKGLNPDEHRWYWISTDVYEIDGAFIGVAGVSSLKSESMGFDDCEIYCEAFEMVPVQTTTYVEKPKETEDAREE